MPPDFCRHLEDDELVCPGRELALAPELPELPDHGQHGVGCGLVREIIELGAGDLQLLAAPACLAPGDPQQQFMQAAQRRVPLRSEAGKRPDPLR